MGRFGYGFGVSRYPRGGSMGAGGPPLLSALALLPDRIQENSVEDDVVGAVLGAQPGAVLALTDSAGGRFKLVGSELRRGATAVDAGVAISHPVTVRETLGAAANSPRDTVLTVTIFVATMTADLTSISVDTVLVTADASEG